MKFQALLRQLNTLSDDSKGFEQRYFYFGIAGVILHSLPFFLWQVSITHQTLDLYLRAIAILLSGTLIFLPDLFLTLRKFKPLYWRITLIYTLPFLTNYILLENELSVGWLIQVILSSVVLMFLVKWKDYVLYTFLGTFFAWILFWYVDPTLLRSLNLASLMIVLYAYVICLFISFIFISARERSEREKIETIQALSGSIAHEIGTPLSSIQLYTSTLSKYLPNLINYYVQKHPKEESILREIQEIPFQISLISQNAFNITEMLKMSLKDIKEAKISPLRIASEVKKALKEYPMTEEEKGLINIEIDNNFTFKGNSLIFSHILFNLTKNALFFIKKARKGSIFVHTEEDMLWNKLIFKDTGYGIDEEFLPHIFDRFYSKRNHGTGLGLFFCTRAMEAFNGEIRCFSEKGKYAKFILYFPKA